MIGIHVLPKQGDLTHAARNQITRLTDQAINRARHLGSARIGHHTERTELVAAFLNRQKRRRPTPRCARLWQQRKFVFFGKVRIQRLLTPVHSLHHRGQAMIGLRPDNQINQRLTPHDLFPLSLRDTSGHANLQIGVCVPQRAQTAKLGIHLFRRLFADMARVEENHIRALWRVDLLIPTCAQSLSHALTVIDVHLTAIGLHKQLLGHLGVPRPWIGKSQRV